MPVFRHTQVINLSVSDVFKTVVDIANFPKWNPTVKRGKEAVRWRCKGRFTVRNENQRVWVGSSNTC